MLRSVSNEINESQAFWDFVVSNAQQCREISHEELKHTNPSEPVIARSELLGYKDPAHKVRLF